MSVLRALHALSPPPAFLPCPVCGGLEFREKFGPIRRCVSCGLGMVNPPLPFRGEDENEAYFVEDYLPAHQANEAGSLAERRAHLAQISRWFALPAAPRLLDVGCALGSMLQEARAAGWRPFGVETSAFAARYAAQKTGCPVHRGTLQSAAFSPGSFDVVTLMDVIEHVTAPDRLMAEVWRVLAPCGVVFLITPNFSSFFVRLFGPRAYAIWPDQHVVYFDRGSMRRLLAQSGFSNPRVSTKDLYAPNLHRLINRPGEGTEIKAAFAGRRWPRAARSLANAVFARIPLGDKLVAAAQKPSSPAGGALTGSIE